MTRSGVTIKFNHIPRIRRQLEPRAKDIVVKLVGELETIVKTSMQGSKGGAFYSGHQASAPGEAPAIDTGQLFGAMQQSFEDNGMTGVLAFLTEYAIHLEFGTTKMAPRPFARPAIESMRARVKSAFNQLARL